MAPAPPDGVSIRTATADDHVAVSRVLDGALLDVADLQRRLADGTVLVATREARTGDTSGTVVGAVVLAPEGLTEQVPPAEWLAEWPGETHVRGIAVRRRRRRSGVGTALLAAALRRWEPLVADFDPNSGADVEPFYVEFERAVSGETLEVIEGDPSVELRDGPDGRRWALLRVR